MNAIKKEEYVKTQIDKIMNKINRNDFEDKEDMINHIKELNMDVLLLVKILEYVYEY